MEEAEATTDLSKTTMDPSLHKKHQAMLQRLSNRHQTKPSPTKTASTTTAATFLTQFTHSKNSIESQLSNISNLTTSTDDLKSHLADISSFISSLEQYLAENSYLLPSYELRSSLKTISDLKQSLDNLTSRLLPKKKFSFRNKSTNPKKPEPEPILPENTEPPIGTSLVLKDSPGLRNQENQILTMSFKGSEIGEFTLQNLHSCEVRLIGCVNALFVNGLRDCKVYVGPVIGSVLIEGIESCVFVLASHQIRIHDAKQSDFYLRVRSRPIIEDCGGVRFGPYCLRYEGIDDDLRTACLDQENENWSNVDDFKWLRAVQSPNWCVLEENERIGEVEVKDFECGN